MAGCKLSTFIAAMVSQAALSASQPRQLFNAMALLHGQVDDSPPIMPATAQLVDAPDVWREVLSTPASKLQPASTLQGPGGEYISQQSDVAGAWQLPCMQAKALDNSRWARDSDRNIA